MKGCFLVILVFVSSGVWSQDEISPIGRAGSVRKGQFYATWGYNRAFYNKSDLHLKGEGFDFTIYDATASDMPEKFDPDVYFNLAKLTIPQFNFRLGYYFKKNSALSLGWDHMKYRLSAYQLVRMEGGIDEEKFFGANTGHLDGYYLYSPQFMDFHHSDGLNFIRVALEQRVPVWQSRNQKHELVFNGAISGGVVMPWTDFTFYGEYNRNFPHVAGYGFSVLMGTRFEFFKHFFIQVQAHTGWLNLSDIVIEGKSPSRADQKIVFFERSFALGGYIPIFNRKPER